MRCPPALRTSSLLVALAAVSMGSGLGACSPAKPAEGAETESAASGEKTDKGDKGEDGAKDKDKDSATAGDREGNQGGGAADMPAGPKVDKSLSLDTYEMTPADCDALGQHYGEVGRSDQVATLSPKLNEKQRSATVAQIDKVVGKLEESWTNGCHTSLQDKAVDHDAIKCALAARTVKDFDVCFNGLTTTQADGGNGGAGKGGKKKK